MPLELEHAFLAFAVALFAALCGPLSSARLPLGLFAGLISAIVAAGGARGALMYLAWYLVFIIMVPRWNERLARVARL